MTIRWLTMAALLTLAGCGDHTQWAQEVCHERDTVSGRCLNSEYICTKPLELRAYLGGPVCVMPANSRGIHD